MLLCCAGERQSKSGASLPTSLPLQQQSVAAAVMAGTGSGDVGVGVGVRTQSTSAAFGPPNSRSKSLPVRMCARSRTRVCMFFECAHACACVCMLFCVYAHVNVLCVRAYEQQDLFCCVAICSPVSILCWPISRAGTLLPQVCVPLHGAPVPLQAHTKLSCTAKHTTHITHMQTHTCAHTYTLIRTNALLPLQACSASTRMLGGSGAAAGSGGSFSRPGKGDSGAARRQPGSGACSQPATPGLGLLSRALLHSCSLNPDQPVCRLVPAEQVRGVCVVCISVCCVCCVCVVCV